VEIPGGDNAAFLPENAKELLRICIKSIQDLSRHYLYRISGEESIPSNPSYLLSIREADLMEIFKTCGFYKKKMRGTFQWTASETWFSVTFERGAVEVTTFYFEESNKKESLIMIVFVLVGHPSQPAYQVKEKLDPPRF
jgi:hypothetical protein